MQMICHNNKECLNKNKYNKKLKNAKVFYNITKSNNQNLISRVQIFIALQTSNKIKIQIT